MKLRSAGFQGASVDVKRVYACVSFSGLFLHAGTLLNY